MANYPYTQVPGKLRQLLEKIRLIGVPPKATVQWLKTVGFKSSNDATMIPVLKFIGFLDASNAPTARWNQFRGADAKQILGKAIRDGYAELYGIYPDAHVRSQADLENVFSTSSTAGRQAITKTVSTFKALVSEAEFSDVPTAAVHAPGPLHSPVAPSASASSSLRTPGAPSLHIDIQVHIAPEASTDQIDQIFASMAKHLYGGAKSG